MNEYVWPDPHSDGWIDAWNGWYPTKEQALEDAEPAVRENRPKILSYGEGLITQDEMEWRERARD